MANQQSPTALGFAGRTAVVLQQTNQPWTLRSDGLVLIVAPESNFWAAFKKLLDNGDADAMENSALNFRKEVIANARSGVCRPGPIVKLLNQPCQLLFVSVAENAALYDPAVTLAQIFDVADNAGLKSLTMPLVRWGPAAAEAIERGIERTLELIARAPVRSLEQLCLTTGSDRNVNTAIASAKKNFQLHPATAAQETTDALKTDGVTPERSDLPTADPVGNNLRGDDALDDVDVRALDHEAATDALPRVFNDRSDAIDLLQIDREVTAFARLAISRGISPPLSIGVFGDWGSGKSFFMEKVKAKIDRLTDAAQLHDEGDRNLHHEVAQIRFNAWHYIETNLWASLVGFIFAELDRWLRLQGGAAGAEVDALFDQLATSRQLKLEAYRDLVSAQAEAARAQVAADEARARHQAALRAPMTAFEIWSAAASSFVAELPPKDLADLRSLAQTIGAPDVEQSVTDAAQLVKDTGSQAVRSRVVVDSLVAQAGSFYGAVLIVVALLAPTLVMFVASWVFTTNTVASLHEIVLGCSGSLAVLTGLGAKALATAKEQLASLDRLRARLEANLLQRTSEERETQLQAEAHAQATAQLMSEAERRAAEASDRVILLLREQEGQSSSGRLNRFIREKVTNGDYARHLGIVASIHKDFSQLSDLLQQRDGDRNAAVDAAVQRARNAYLKSAEALIDQAAAEGAPLTPAQCADLLEMRADAGPPPGVGRIVLYIDDLDRCPPEKVVDVLQAIHMLLFFPLFVVFVAVDARWLRRSLRIRFPDLIEDRLVASPPRDVRNTGVQEGGEASVAKARVRPADAQDYLEKIFQIPFWVSPMTVSQGGDFVRGLTADLLEDPPMEDLGPDADADLDPGPYDDGADSSEVQYSINQEDEASTRAATLNPYSGDYQSGEADLMAVTLTDAERDILAEFGARLGGSPRRTKRYVNTYLLIKIGQLREIGSGDAMESAAWAIAAMLAVVVGAREASERFFEAVDRLSGAEMTLVEFIEGLAEARNGIDGAQLGEILAAMKSQPGRFVPGALAKFAPIVRRFAF